MAEKDLRENELRIFLETEKGVERVRCRMRGDGAVLAQMIAHVCVEDSRIFSAFVSGVAGAMEEKGFSTLDLRRLARGAGINL